MVVAEILDSVLERASALRTAGVTHFSIGDLSVHLDRAAGPELKSDLAVHSRDPLADPATFAGGIPQFAGSRRFENEYDE